MIRWIPPCGCIIEYENGTEIAVKATPCQLHANVALADAYGAALQYCRDNPLAALPGGE